MTRSLIASYRHQPARRPARPRSGYVAALALIMPFLLGGCSTGILDPKGPIGAAEKLMLINSLGIMLAIVIPVIVATLAFAWWFRAGNARARYLPTWNYSGRIELVIWSIPAMVVILLGGISWIGSHDLDPPRPIAAKVAPIRVEVVSLDWKWLFIYPDQGIATVNELVVPAGTPVSFRLTSGTVWNSFFVPQLGSQIYTMAGMATRLNLMADHPGVYRGQSAHFSGDGFSDMHFAVRAVAPGEFNGWVNTVRSSSTSLDKQSFVTLAKPSKADRPASYGRVEAGLFDEIMRISAPSKAPGGMNMPGHAHAPSPEI